MFENDCLLPVCPVVVVDSRVEPRTQDVVTQRPVYPEYPPVIGDYPARLEVMIKA